MNVELTLDLPENIVDGNWHKFTAYFKIVDGKTVMYHPQLETHDFDAEIRHVARHGHKNLTYEKLMERRFGGWEWISGGF